MSTTTRTSQVTVAFLALLLVPACNDGPPPPSAKVAPSAKKPAAAKATALAAVTSQAAAELGPCEDPTRKPGFSRLDSATGDPLANSREVAALPPAMGPETQPFAAPAAAGAGKAKIKPPLDGIELTSGNGQSAFAGSALPDALVITMRTKKGDPVPGLAVAFEVVEGGGTLSAATAMTDAAGQASTKLTLGPLPGANRVKVSVTGVMRETYFMATATAIPASSIELVSGNAQTGLAGAALANPFVVLVKNAMNAPVQGYPVAWSVVEGGGKLSAAQVLTDAQGYASVVLTLGVVPGKNTVTANTPGLTGSPVTFGATGMPAPASAIAVASGNNQTGTVGKPLAQPFVVTVTDVNQQPVAGFNVVFAVATGGGALSAGAVATNAQGQAATVLTLGPAPGANTVTASAQGLAGSPITFAASGLAAPASRIAVVSGDAQMGVAGSPLAQPLVVVVTDASGGPVAGFNVAFAVTSGGGALSAATVATDAQGRAASTLTLGRVAGPNRVTATAAGLTGSPIAFNATGVAGPATSIEIASGNDQTAQVGAPLANPLVVAVRDVNGNGVANVVVNFAVALGGGTLTVATAPSSPQGLASTRLTLGPAPGVNRVTATSQGLAGSPLTFNANGLAAPATQIALGSGDQQTGVAGAALAQPFVVVVRDAGNNPVQGFTVAFAVAAGGGSVSAATAVTNAQGQAATLLTLGRTAGPNRVTATAAGLTGSPIAFSATGTAGPATQIAIASGNNQSAQAGTALANPLVVVVRDVNQNPVANVQVAFAVATGGGALSAASAATDAQGQASTRLTLGPVPAANTVTVSSPGLNGSPLTFTAMGLSAPATQVAIATGNAQTGVAGAALAQPFVVVVRDAGNNPVQGFMVQFAVVQGSGTLSAGSVATNAQGQAQSILTLGRTAGPNSVTASAAGLTGSPLTFNATGTAGPATQLVIVSGNNQSAPVGTALANPLVVAARDANGNGVVNVAVTFAVATGGGTVSVGIAPTNGSGLAQTALTVGPNAGANTVTASSPGLAGSPVTFTAMGTAAAATQVGLASGNAQTGVAGSALAAPFVVVVRDAANNPVQGFMVSFAVATGGGTLSAGSVATNAQGQAQTILTLGRTAGPNSVNATAQGLTGSPVTFTATGTAGAATQIALVSGNAQSGAAGTPLPLPLVVAVRDVNNNPVAGVQIAFAATAGGGTLSVAMPTTNAQGQAQTVLTPGPGANTVTATRAGLSGSPVTFTATGQSVATQLVVATGNNQSARIGMPLAAPLVVTARDAGNNPVPGVSVTFAITAGGGTLSVTMAATDAQGRAQTVLTLGPNLGANTVSATAAGLTAASFTAMGTALTYVDDVKPIMTAKCILCHAPGGVLAAKPLTTYDQLRNQLSFANMPFVVPNQPAQSVIVQKTQAGGTMADKLTAAEAKVILDWVRVGAVDGGVAQVPASLAVVSGDAQQGVPAQPLANPFLVVVRDAANAPIAGVNVSWAVVTGGGSLSAASSTTDLLGQAMVRLTLGPAAGANSVRATVTGLTPLTFTANAVSGFSGAPLAGSTNPLDVAALSVLQAQSIEPARLTTDGEFLRRTTSLLIGRLPTESELSAFLADASSTKRAATIDRLLAMPEFNSYWTRSHLAVWLQVPTQVQVDNNGVVSTYNSDSALIANLAADMSLRTIVTRLATSQGDEGMAFQVVHDGYGQTRMADQLMWAFTGITSKCARCHDHPLTQATDDPRWLQDDNYGLYAFFATNQGEATKLNKTGNRFGTPLQPRFVADGYGNVPPANVTLADPIATRRARFATLFTASNAFARGTSHRIWAEIAAPLLDPNQFLQSNLAMVRSPALLSALAQVFNQQNGSLKGFLRVAMNSKLYQLSSEGTANQDPFQGRYVLRREHGEVLEAGVSQLAGVANTQNGMFQFNFGFPDRSSLESRRSGVALEQALVQLNSPISTNGKVTMSSSQIGALAAAIDGGAIKQIIPSANLVNAGGGAGLDAAIYDTIDFTGPALNRVHPQVNFDFGGGGPDPAIQPDTFSIRWTGRVRIPTAGSYTFYTTSDDGVRLYIDGNLVIDRYIDQGPTEYATPAMNLTAGDHQIRIDYYENGGGAVMTLAWSSASLGGAVTFDDAVKTIVRSALSRDPTAAELTATRTARTGAANTRQALEDVAVAVGSSTEFLFR